MVFGSSITTLERQAPQEIDMFQGLSWTILLDTVWMGHFLSHRGGMSEPANSSCVMQVLDVFR